MANLVVASVGRSQTRTDVNLQTSVADVMSLGAALGTDAVMVVADPAKIPGTLNLRLAVELLFQEIEQRAGWPTER